MRSIFALNRRLIPVAQSRRSVLVTIRPEDNLLRTAVSPWPPAEIVQKLYQSNHLKAFDQADAANASAGLGFYTDLQSLQSEDAITWSVFGPLIYGESRARQLLAKSLLGVLRLPFQIAGPVTCWLWRRLPHPDTLVSGGPEIDCGIQSPGVLVLGEAK